METICVPRTVFTKILEDAEMLIADVELALNAKVQERIADITADPSIGKNEKELDAYLKKRGVKVD